ncbi:MAG TPA: ABC transporter substrate-binding protein [Humibacter sp.]|nr:ABC transporter substrate-binding protein [Humibacter sp.]
MRFGKTLSLAAASAAMLLAVSGCSATASGDAPAAGGSSSTDVTAGVKVDPAAAKLLPASTKKAGTLTVAMDLNYPPTSFLASDNATAIGFNPDFVRLIGKKLGLKISIENVSFDTIIPGIAAGRYDFTATDMSATPERLKVLSMIDYWDAGSSLVVSAGNPMKLSLADNSLCGHSIGVTLGSTQAEQYVPLISKKCEAAGGKAVKAVVLPNVQDALTQLASKRIDGVFYDTSSLGWAAKKQSQSFELLTPQYKKESGTDLVALGIAKDSPLIPALHAATQSVLDSPQYKKALNAWGLGAGAITTATLLK